MVDTSNPYKFINVSGQYNFDEPSSFANDNIHNIHTKQTK